MHHLEQVSRLFIWFVALEIALHPMPVRGQEPFPAGIEGELYYCPRIDLNPVKEGGPLTIELDGLFDDEAWQRAAFHHYLEYWKGGVQPSGIELNSSWAAVADEDFLYVAWRSVDDTRHTEATGCAVFNDDTVEVYLDGKGDAIGCGSCVYSLDDAQILVSASEIGKDDPDTLEVGYVRSGNCVGQGTITDPISGEILIRGVVQELVTEEDETGWQGEIAIALTNMAVGDWQITPTHGATVGFDVHLDNDRNGGNQDVGQDTAMIWSKRDPGSTAWQNPGVFGKLQFISPSKPLVSIVRDLPDGLRNGGSGRVSLTVTPQFGVGTVGITEELPPGLSASDPSAPGVLAGSVITWNLGQVNSEVTVSYTLTAAADASDVEFLGNATIDGEPLDIGGDRAYTGSPISTQGFIKLWNHLGPLASGLANTATCNTADLGLDWIVNEGESITEADVQPFPGMVIRPKWGGDGLVPGTGARATGVKLSDGRIVKDQALVWHTGISSVDTIFHEAPDVNGFNADEQVTMSSVYVTNTGEPIDTQIGADSDDAIQVYLGDQAQIPDLQCRGLGGANTETSFFPVNLPRGESRILVKVADGGGNSGFRLRFQDPADPLGPGLIPPLIKVSVESSVSPPPVRVVRDLSRDVFSLAEPIDVTLAITAANPGTTVKLTEVPPSLSAVSQISDGGTFNGTTIEWSLSGVSAKTVSYRLAPAACVGLAAYGLSTWKVDAVEGIVTGESAASRVPVKELPLGEWTSRDLGTAAGAAEPIADHDVVVQAAGAGVKGSQDEFRFISLPHQGDFSLTARIDCLDDPGKAGQAGLMVRDTNDPFAATLFYYLSSAIPTGGGVGTLKVLFRRETAVRSVLPVTFPLKDVPSFPIYLKLARTGAKLSFQRSSDGAAYTEVLAKDIGTANMQQINLRDETLVGLAVSGQGAGATRATFRDVSGPAFGSEALSPPALTAAISGDRRIILTWTPPAGGPAPESYTIHRGPAGGPYTMLTEVPAAKTDYQDTGLAIGAQFCYVVRSKRGSSESANSNEKCGIAGHQDNVFRRGDVDASGTLDISDAVGILSYLFQGTGTPNCLEAADTDDSGDVDITDAVNNLGYQFLGQAPPFDPGPINCGPDPHAPFLGCEQQC